VPVRVTGTVVPCVPVVGLIETSVGPCTVIETVLLAPAGLVTVTVCAPSAAVVLLDIANVAVSGVDHRGLCCDVIRGADDEVPRTASKLAFTVTAPETMSYGQRRMPMADIHSLDWRSGRDGTGECVR
jgi:hypothetical protein